MPLAVRSHVEAEADLLDATLYYAERSTEVAAQFLAAVDDALAQIAEMPLSAPRWPDLSDVRRCVLGAYPYAIIYAVELDAIVVLAFEHTKRRPGYWLGRLAR